MSLKIKDIKTEGYERVIHATNETTNLDCLIAIHSTKLGPALGGVRSWHYSSFEKQKKDVLKLSEAMTLKNSICGINFGGGKAALNLKNAKKTPELYHSYAEVVESLNGNYLTAGDVNTFKDDLIECSKISSYVYGINVETSAPTARGLFYAMISSNKFINNKKDLSGMHVAISGVGKVGGKLAKILSNANVKLSAASKNVELMKKLKSNISIIEVEPENLFKTKCDIISPCALGNAINKKNINQLRCKSVIGAANNQLENLSIDKSLFKRKIVYSPDYLVNSGGVIAIAAEINKSESQLEKHLKMIGDRLLLVLEESKKNNQSTDIVARRMAIERINS